MIKKTTNEIKNRKQISITSQAFEKLDKIVRLEQAKGIPSNKTRIVSELIMRFADL